MKKLIIAAAALAMGFAANAACVNWKVTGTSATEGYTVLLFTAQPATKYDSYAAFEAASIAQAEIVAKTGARGTTYATETISTINDSVTSAANFYMAIISSDSAKTYNFTSVAMGANVYEVGQTPAATFLTTAATIAGGTQGKIGGGDVPEPTSAMLMLLGVAGLALKRKRA